MARLFDLESASLQTPEVRVAGYDSTEPRHDVSYRRVRVETERAGVAVRTRESSFDD